MKEDIKQIQKRIDEVVKPKEQNVAKRYGSSSFGFRIVIDLFSGIFVGAGIGYFFDDLFGSKPVFFAVFLFFGAAAGFLNVYKTYKIEEKKRG